MAVLAGGMMMTGRRAVMDPFRHPGNKMKAPGRVRHRESAGTLFILYFDDPQGIFHAELRG